MDDEEDNPLDQEHLAQLRRRWLARIKYFPCPHEGAQAILIVDVETEEKPLRDVQGNLQYSCPICHAVIHVDKERHVVPPRDDEPLQ